MKFVFALSVALATLCSSADARPRHSHVRTVEHASIWSGIFGGGLVSTARSHLGSTAGQLGLPRSLWNPLVAFVARYRNDRVAFVREVLAPRENRAVAGARA
jgi:hypothetical protein